MSAATMKAAVHDRYGPPEACGSRRWSGRYRTTTRFSCGCTPRRSPRPTVTCAERSPSWRFMLGLRRPKRRILGLELAGEVAAVGGAVTGFEVGDRVFGMRSGAHAEYVCVRRRGSSGPCRLA